MPLRNLAEIPRLTSDAKKHILGRSAVGEFSKIRVQKEISEKGHPLLWGEWKPVTLYSTLYRDLQVADVVDLTPGSGAACLAALYCGLFYVGFGYNEAHRGWIQYLMKGMIMAMVLAQDKSVAADAELVKNVGAYLQSTAEAAKRLLPKNCTKGTAFGDSHTGDNDSDAEIDGEF